MQELNVSEIEEVSGTSPAKAAVAIGGKLNAKDRKVVEKFLGDIL